LAHRDIHRVSFCCSLAHPIIPLIPFTQIPYRFLHPRLRPPRSPRASHIPPYYRHQAIRVTVPNARRFFTIHPRSHSRGSSLTYPSFLSSSVRPRFVHCLLLSLGRRRSASRRRRQPSSGRSPIVSQG
ncbi:hypothetical protein HN011_005431, partial [Eciton burchellii]